MGGNAHNETLLMQCNWLPTYIFCDPTQTLCTASESVVIFGYLSQYVPFPQFSLSEKTQMFQGPKVEKTQQKQYTQAPEFTKRNMYKKEVKSPLKTHMQLHLLGASLDKHQIYCISLVPLPIFLISAWPADVMSLL